jgi:hypothetical protein
MNARLVAGSDKWRERSHRAKTALLAAVVMIGSAEQDEPFDPRRLRQLHRDTLLECPQSSFTDIVSPNEYIASKISRSASW